MASHHKSTAPRLLEKLAAGIRKIAPSAFIQWGDDREGGGIVIDVTNVDAIEAKLIAEEYGGKIANGVVHIEIT
ncbi:MAG: hypothetical protein KatS3mg054_0088 [Chloroflexus sp.]|nr:MAG: hypothetical protein KatS3mg054_0088 [Chloroflexus sp.]